MPKVLITYKGGPGSGFRDHKGIPGHRGGSLPEYRSSDAGKYLSKLPDFVTLLKPGFGFDRGAYCILPDGRALKINYVTHAEFADAYYKLNGDTNKNLLDLENAGGIRISNWSGLGIEAAKVNSQVLQKVQELFTSGKLKIREANTDVSFDDISDDDMRFDIFTFEEFMNANKLIKVRDTENGYDRNRIVLKELKIVRLKGGPGSGHKGHKGIPGHQGGSLPEGNISNSEIPYKPELSAVRSAEVAEDFEIDAIESDRDLSPYLQKELAELPKYVAEAEIRLRISPENLIEVLQDGRFKTQFETGASGGTYAPDYRKSAEEAGLGVPEDFDISKRPIYGYLFSPELPLADQVDMYGDMVIHIKPEVKSRTTATLGDSLGGFDEGYCIGTPMLNFKKGSFNTNLDAYLRTKYKAGNAWYDYTEAQIHGGLYIKDIASIEFGANLANSDLVSIIKEDAARAGISVLDYDPSPAARKKENDLGSSMICFNCEDVELEINQGMEDKHITLVYLGKSEDVNVNEVISKMAEFSNSHNSIIGEFNGFAVFDKCDGETFPIVLLYDSPDVPSFRDDIISMFPYAVKNHGFIPHMTIGWSSLENLSLSMSEKFFNSLKINFPIMHTFTSVDFWHGKEHYRFPLKDNRSLQIVKSLDENEFDLHDEISKFSRMTIPTMTIIGATARQTLKRIGSCVNANYEGMYNEVLKKSHEFYIKENGKIPDEEDQNKILRMINDGISKDAGIEYSVIFKEVGGKDEQK